MVANSTRKRENKPLLVTLQRSFLVLEFIVPILLLQIISETVWILCASSFMLQYLGLLVERRVNITR